MFKSFLILCFFTSQIFASTTRPLEPKGWVEMNSDGPVLLTWAKAPEKGSLEEAPTLMVQNFERDEKMQTFIKAKALDKKGCFDLTEEGWKQTWCPRSSKIFVILSRGEDSELPSLKEKLQTWVLSHD
jgi:hypothetical protein